LRKKKAEDFPELLVHEVRFELECHHSVQQEQAWGFFKEGLHFNDGRLLQRIAQRPLQNILKMMCLLLLKRAIYLK